MVVLAVVLFIMGVVSFAVGFVLFANGVGAAPQSRTENDPTGVKRAASRVPWRDVFRHAPKSVSLLTGRKGSREDKLAAFGSLLVLIGIVAWCVAVLSLIVAYL